MATTGSEKLAECVLSAHIETFQMTRAVVFLGSTAVIQRTKATKKHQAMGVLRLFVSTTILNAGSDIEFRIKQQNQILINSPSAVNTLEEFGLIFRNNLHLPSKKQLNLQNRFQNSWIQKKMIKFN